MYGLSEFNPALNERSCYRKSVFTTEDLVRKFVNQKNWDNKKEGRKERLRYYFCDVCGLFHVTSKV